MLSTAAVLRDAAGKYSLEEIELPAPQASQVLVRIVSAGICHTDSLLRMAGFPLPMIGGHEGAGVVEAVGAGVTRIAPGDHVVLSFDHCGVCRNCRSADVAYCDEFKDRNLVGFPLDGSPDAFDGAGQRVGSRWFGQSSFATHAIATERNAVVVDKAADLRLLGPLGCGIQTGAGSILLSLGVRAGSTLAVFGSGAVGLAAVMAASWSALRRSSRSTDITTDSRRRCRSARPM
jgi:aryl-alcohol dehydrogenase